ncbi:hypothetical protein [Streptomyces sp. B1I3]|uniref:hypothetical protein n=1 Tax=Streptomyces sp. B1I3 TaxID=3042264 RepID=UPI0027855558|nr:hypothetical protein [Streptomyces sp. B1I3]MDQ0794559.1 hypothetical protein [Streptomyces sp. B1I3]
MSTSTPSEGQPDRDEGPGAVSEEQWAELVRHLDDGGAEAPKEPSARARMVTARLRALDEEAARGGGGARRRGRKGKPAEPWQPEGWRTGPAWQERNGRARKRRRIAATLGMVVVLGALVVTMRPSLLTDHLPGGDSSADAGPLPAETAPPAAAPGDTPVGEQPTRTQPFRGSPALRWADGAAGIEVPEAEAVGGRSKAQVAELLRTTRQFLVAANLDPATLRGEKPKEALALLDPEQKDVQELLDTAWDRPDEKHDPLMLFTRIDPDDARLVGDVVKTRGRMTFEAGDEGTVEVHADYTFVYPVLRAGSQDEVTRTIVRRRLTTVLHDPERTRMTPGTLSFRRYEQYAANTTCEVHDGFLHPGFPGDAPETQPAGPAVDPYDRSRVAGEGPCGTFTRI